MSDINMVQKALREAAGASNSQIRDAARHDLASFGAKVIAQQTTRSQQIQPAPQVQIPTVQATLPARQFLDSVGTGAGRGSESAASVPLLTFRVAVNGTAQDVLIAATILPAA